MTTSTKATAKTTSAKTTSAKTTTKKSPFAGFITKACTAQKALKSNFDKTVSKEADLAAQALASVEMTPTDGATELYSLLVATNTADSLQAASGAQLAAAVQTMIEAFYNGDNEALSPVLQASGLWIELKTDGTVKTANIPNNLRLLVGRRSTKYAQENELDIKLTLSVEKNELVIKQSPITPTTGKSKAQKVFDMLTKLDMMDLDELTRLVATDGQLTDAFSLINAVASPEVSKVATNKAELVARRDKAAELESRLDSELVDALNFKAELVDQVDELEGELDTLEAALSAHREADTMGSKEAKQLLSTLTKTTKALDAARSDLAKANAKVAELDKANTAQANLCQALGQRLAAIH